MVDGDGTQRLGEIELDPGESAETVKPEAAKTPNDTTPPRSQTPVPHSDRYPVLDVIGTGGMGKVYKAFDRKLRRPVALKFLRGADPALERRFLQEAQAQARVDHPHVCKVYEVGRIGEDPYIAMQYIDGKTLRDVSKQ